MKVETLKLDGKKGSIEVTDKIFSAKINKKLVSAVLYKTNANYKKRHAKTKQLNEVSGPTSKIYAQKDLWTFQSPKEIKFYQINVHYSF